jgi:hypothetical protein
MDNRDKFNKIFKGMIPETISDDETEPTTKQKPGQKGIKKISLGWINKDSFSSSESDQKKSKSSSPSSRTTGGLKTPGRHK